MTKIQLVLRFKYVNKSGATNTIAVIGSVPATMDELRNSTVGLDGKSDKEVIAQVAKESVELIAERASVTGLSFLTGRYVYIPPAVFGRCVIDCSEPTEVELQTRVNLGLE